jgi:UDPglucose 6-dehydrogenase
VEYAADPYQAAESADALLILTEWEEFAQLDLARLAGTMKYLIVIDGRNLYDGSAMTEHGFTYYSVGRATAVPDDHSAPVTTITHAPVEIPQARVHGQPSLQERKA